MTHAEKKAALHTISDAEDAAMRAFNRVAEDHCEEIDGRKCAIARTEIEKAFAVARNVFHAVESQEA